MEWPSGDLADEAAEAESEQALGEPGDPDSVVPRLKAQMSALQPALDLRRPRAAQLRSPSSALLLVANANASGLAGRRELVEDARRLLRHYGARVDTHVTASVEELAALLDDHADGRVVLLGGDGTLHAVANLPGPKPEVALLPAGKANNIARSLGIPTERRAAAEVAVRGRARSLDAIAVESPEGRYLAVEGVSVGFLALARERYRSENSADLVAGAAAGLSAFRRFRPLKVAIESDGAAEIATIGQLFVANLPLYGFGLRVAPDADAADGLLDVVAIEASGRASLLPMLAQLRKGSHVGRPGVRTWRARRVRLATGGRSPVIADSANLGPGPVDLSVEPGAIEIVVPQG